MSTHHWRQADCLSITKNYFEEGMHFLNPKVHSLTAPRGEAVSEFPIINYTVALLWRVFGEHEFIYKLLEYLIFLTAIFVLFNTLLRHFFSRVYSFFLVSVLLTSPLLVYYSFNFLSDVPALSFAIISFSLLFSFTRTKKMWNFYLSLFTATLAVLLKASALIPMLLITVFLVVDVLKLNKRLNTERLFNKTLLPAICTASSIILIYLWYTFARRYNSFNNGFFLLTIAPVWDMHKQAALDNMKSLFSELFPVFLNRPMLALFVCLKIIIVFNFKKLDTFLKYAFVCSGLFFLFYIIIFFQVFTVHDYYLINLFIFPVISFFCLLHIVSQIALPVPASLKYVLLLIFILNAFFAAASYRVRLVEKDKLVNWYPFISNDEFGYFDYVIWDYNNKLVPVKKLKPVLKELGAKRSDVVLTLTNGGPDVALYLLDQKGYEISQQQLAEDSLCLKKLLSKKVKYIVLNDFSYKKQAGFTVIEPLFVSVYRTSLVEIFKIR